MKQHIESAAIALGVGILAYIAYRSFKKPASHEPYAPYVPITRTPSEYLNLDLYYDGQGNHTSAGILDARDHMAWGGRQIGSVS